MKEENYLTNMPEHISEYGFCKVLNVRREVIHIKHIFTEIFVRKSIDIKGLLSKLNMDLYSYMEHMTNRLRRVHHFSRKYKNDLDKIVKFDRDNFFPAIELLKGHKILIILDFDGVVTSNNFKPIYDLCLDRCDVCICSANPTITLDWFEKRGARPPKNIFSMKGKVKKLRKILELSKKNDYVFYIDNEKEYLEFAWVFGVKTFHYDGKKVKHFSLKTK